MDAKTLLPRRDSPAADYDKLETSMPGWQSGRGPDDIDATVVERPKETVILGWLIVKESKCFRRGHVWKLREGSIYGRDPKKPDGVIDDNKVSGIHARIKLEYTTFTIFDLGSRNGTFINGERVIQAKKIDQDDEIRIGDTVFVLKTLFYLAVLLSS